MNPNARILTGHRPTGPRHIGHLVGTLHTWAALQENHPCFFLVADLHVLTTQYETPAVIRQNTMEMVVDWLAAGIDPHHATLVLQSALPEHAEMSLLLAMLVPVTRLERIPTYKEQVQQLHLNPSLGLLTYPVLQAADILLYKAGAVPVGEDQLPHLELVRELARRFNSLYRPLFPEPEAILSSQPRLPGTDGRTMHASYGNAIYLKDTPEETRRKVLRMYTDPTRLRATDPGHVEGNPVFACLDAFHPRPAELADLKDRYQAGAVGDVEVKELLASLLNETLAPLRARRAELASHPSDVIDLLRMGTDRARPVVQETIEEVREAMGLTLSSRLAVEPAPLGAFC